MASFALTYLVGRFFWRIWNFLHNWYVHGSRKIAHYFILALEEMDRGLAVKVTLQHFFEPLYKDYTIIGRILGVFFRSGRVLIGGVIYIIFATVAIVIYLVWLLIPILIGISIFYSLR